MPTNIYFHNHHIIPRHAGGTDAPDNIVRLTVKEHSEAHRLLYEEYGRWQDRLAWLAIAGYIGKEEIISMKIGESNKSRIVSEETKKKISEAMKGNSNPMYGRKHSEATKQKISKAGKGVPLGPFTEEHKMKLREASKGRVYPKGKKQSVEHIKKRISARVATVKLNNTKKKIEIEDVNN
jgi:hypothetical protein